MQSEKRSNIETIDQLNSKITILTGEVKLMQSDKETGEQSLQFHVFFDHETCQTKISTGTKLSNGRRVESMQSELDQCQSGYQEAVIIRKELDLCLDELTDEQNSKEQLFQNLRNAQGNITTLKDDKEKLQGQLNSEKAENENLRNRIQQLENENPRFRSESSQNQLEMSDKVRGLTNENENLQSSLDMCQKNLIKKYTMPYICRFLAA